MTYRGQYYTSGIKMTELNVFASLALYYLQFKCHRARRRLSSFQIKINHVFVEKKKKKRRRSKRVVGTIFFSSSTTRSYVYGSDTDDLFIVAIAPHEGVQVDDLPPHSTYYNYTCEQQTNKLTTMYLTRY